MASAVGGSISDIGGPPWIFGLRPGYSYDSWCSAIASILLKQFDDIKSGDRTLAAEKGLGISPSWYWYVARADESFGHGVFACDGQAVAWDPTERGACSFDTGGLWHRYIHTDGATNDAEITILFQKSDALLCAWTTRYRQYLDENYADFGDYVSGSPPKKGTPGIICEQPPNQAKAWTWEARVERKRLDTRMHIRRIHCTHEDEREFGNWVEVRTTYDLPTRKALLSSFLSLVRPHPDFAHLSLSVGEELRGILSNWMRA